MDTKFCNKCETEKSLDCFLWKNKDKGLKHSHCSECYKETRKKSYNKNKDYYLKKNVKKREENYLWMLEYKKDKSCLVCGVNEPVCLDFHHINGDEKFTEVSKMKYSTYSIETIKKEIDKCIILCANCHRMLHSNIITL